MILGKKVVEDVFLAWVEPWEQQCINRKHPTSETMLKRKYGNKKLYDCDNPGFEPLQISRLEIKWCNRKNYQCYNVIVRKAGVKVTDDTEEDYEEFPINSELHFMIRCYYKKNPGDGGIKLVNRESYLGQGEPDDEPLIDEWLENGGSFVSPSTKKRASAQRGSNSKSKEATAHSNSASVPKHASKPKPASKSKASSKPKASSKRSRSSNNRAKSNKRQRHSGHSPQKLPDRKETKEERRARIKAELDAMSSSDEEELMQWSSSKRGPAAFKGNDSDSDSDDDSTVDMS